MIYVHAYTHIYPYIRMDIHMYIWIYIYKKIHTSDCIHVFIRSCLLFVRHHSSMGTKCGSTESVAIPSTPCNCRICAALAASYKRYSTELAWANLGACSKLQRTRNPREGDYWPAIPVVGKVLLLLLLRHESTRSEGWEKPRKQQPTKTCKEYYSVAFAT